MKVVYSKKNEVKYLTACTYTFTHNRSQKRTEAIDSKERGNSDLVSTLATSSASIRACTHWRVKMNILNKYYFVSQLHINRNPRFFKEFKYFIGQFLNCGSNT